MALEIKGSILKDSLTHSLTVNPLPTSNDLNLSSYVLSKSETNSLSLAGAALALRPVVARAAPTFTVIEGGGGVAGDAALGGTLGSIGLALASLSVAGLVYYNENHGGAVDIFTYYGDLVFDWLDKEPTINPLEKEKQFRQLDAVKMKEAYDIDMSLALHQLGLYENGGLQVINADSPTPVYFDVRASRDPKEKSASKKGRSDSVRDNNSGTFDLDEAALQVLREAGFVEVRDTKTGAVSFTNLTGGLDPQEKMLLEARANPLKGRPTGVMKKFFQTVEEAKKRGSLKINDKIRPGYMNPHIPVREIEIEIGQGTTRYSLQVIISLMQGGTNFSAKADLFRLSFDGEGPSANFIDAQSIGFAKDWNFLGIPYYEIEPGLTEEGMRAYSPEQAIKAVAPYMIGFEDLVAEFLELINPH